MKNTIEKGLIDRINSEHRECEKAARSAVGHAIAAGDSLIKVKLSLDHGEFGAWIRDNFEGSERTAQAYMRCAMKKDELLRLKPQTSAGLSIDAALKVLSAPKEKTSEEASESVLPDLPSKGREAIKGVYGREVSSKVSGAIKGAYGPDVSPKDLERYKEALRRAKTDTNTVRDMITPVEISEAMKEGKPPPEHKAAFDLLGLHMVTIKIDPEAVAGYIKPEYIGRELDNAKATIAWYEELAKALENRSRIRAVK